MVAFLADAGEWTLCWMRVFTMGPFGDYGCDLSDLRKLLASTGTGMEAIPGCCGCANKSCWTSLGGCDTGCPLALFCTDSGRAIVLWDRRSCSRQGAAPVVGICCVACGTSRTRKCGPPGVVSIGGPGLKPAGLGRGEHRCHAQVVTRGPQ